jgi:hypothetical protein
LELEGKETIPLGIGLAASTTCVGASTLNFGIYYDLCALKGFSLDCCKGPTPIRAINLRLKINPLGRLC